MIAFVGGFIAGLIGVSLLAVQATTAVALAFGAGLVSYLGACWMWPCCPCPRCGGDDKVRDSKGNYRRTVCGRCHGSDYQRPGARLMGWGKR